MANEHFTRRQLVAGALAGAAAALLQPAAKVAAETPPASKSEAETAAGTEGSLLTALVAVNAGYPLTETQAKEAAAQLKDYPGGFTEARKRAIPDDVAPAFAPLPPAGKRGRR